MSKTSIYFFRRRNAIKLQYRKRWKKMEDEAKKKKKKKKSKAYEGKD